MATPYIYTEDQIKHAEDQLLIGDGYDPKLVTEDMRADVTDKRFDTLRNVRSYLSTGLESKQSTIQKGINATNEQPFLEEAAKHGAKQQIQRIDQQEKLDNPDYQPINMQTWLDTYDAKKAALSRDLSTSDLYADSTRTSTAIPRERQTSYLIPPPVSNATQRQVSVPNLGAYEPPVGYEQSVTDTIVADAGKDAVTKLQNYLSFTVPGFTNLSKEEKGKEIWNVLTSLQKDMSGSGAHIAAQATDAELAAGGVFAPKQTNSLVPDISMAGSLYLKSLRSSLAQRKKDELIANGVPEGDAAGQALAFAQDTLGKPQWWQDPTMKKTMLSKAPEFEGMLGMGVYKYPTGATIESDPAYTARMIASPANFVTGLVSTGWAERLGATDYLKQREQSDVTPVAQVSDDMSWYDKTVTRSLDNVAKNRAVAEEVYDLTDVYTDNPTIKNAAYIAGLVGDVVAMPIVPGSGLVGGALKSVKGIGIADKILLDLPKAEKLSKTEKLIYTVGNIANENPVTKYTIGKLAEHFGPGDIRLVAATKLSDAAIGTRALEDAIYGTGRMRDTRKAIDIVGNVAVDAGTKASRNEKVLDSLGVSLGKDSSMYVAAKKAADAGEDLYIWGKKVADSMPPNLTKDIDEAIKTTDQYARVGDKAIAGSMTDASGKIVRATGTTSEDIARWVKTALVATEDMPEFIKSHKITGLSDITQAVLINPISRKNLIQAIADEKSLGTVFKAAPGEGSFFLLTGKTAVSTKNLANKIMEAAAQTPVSRAINEATPIKDIAMKTSSGSKVAISGPITTSKIKLTENGIEQIMGWLHSKVADARMENIPIDNMLHEVAYGTISTQTARTIISMQIDEVAATRFGKKIASIGEETIKAMPVKEQNRLLKPVVLREGNIRKGLKQFVNDFNVVDTPISANAQKILNNIQQEMSAMDKTLRIKIQEIVNNPNIAKLYGLAPNPTEREAMLALIFNHPLRESFIIPATANSIAASEKRSAKMVADVVRDLAIHNLPVRASISDWFRPVNISLKSVLEKNPILSGKIDQLTKDLTIALEEAIYNEDKINIVRSYLIDINKLGEPFAKEGFIAVSPDRIEELLTGIYFHAEKEKILQYNLAGLADIAKPKLDASLRSMVTNISRAVPGGRPLGDGDIQQIIVARVKHMINVNANGTPNTTEAFLYNIAGTGIEGIYTGAKAVLESPIGNRFQEAIDRLAFDIIDNHGMTNSNMGEDLEWLEKISKTGRIDATLGDIKTVETIKKIIGSSFDASKFKTYFKDLAKRDSSRAAEMAGWFANGLSTMRNAKYTFMLSLRPRFHGMNFLTAPFIMMSTLGGETTASAMKPNNWLRGAWLSALSSDTMLGDILRGADLNSSMRFNTVAFKDVAGRAYTYRDLADIVRHGGILRSQKGLSSAQDAIQKANEAWLQKGLMAELAEGDYRDVGYKAGKALVPSIIDAANAFAEWSDGAFRMSVLIDSLKAGEDSSQAIQKAREALFDYGKMSAGEKKYISSWMAFYSFQRSAAMNVLTNMIENPTRLANQMKLTKGYVWGDHDRKTKDLYEKEYTQSRPLLNIIDGVDKERYATYAPGMPVADSVFLLAKTFFSIANQEPSQALSIETDRMDPMLRSIMGGNAQSKKMILENGIIDPRDIAWLKATGTFDTFENLFGTFRREPAKPGEPAWGGMKYTMQDNGGNVNKKAAEAYWAFKNYVVPVTLGGDTILKDYAPLAASINPADLSNKGIDLSTNIWEQLGVTTDIRIDSPVEIYTKKAEEENYKLKTLAPDNITRSTN